MHVVSCLQRPCCGAAHCLMAHSVCSSRPTSCAFLFRSTTLNQVNMSLPAITSCMCGHCVHASITLRLVTATANHQMPAWRSHLHSHMHTAGLMKMDVYLRPDYGSNFCKWLRKVCARAGGRCSRVQWHGSSLNANSNHCCVHASVAQPAGMSNIRCTGEWWGVWALSG